MDALWEQLDPLIKWFYLLYVMTGAIIWLNLVVLYKYKIWLNEKKVKRTCIGIGHAIGSGLGIIFMLFLPNEGYRGTNYALLFVLLGLCGGFIWGVMIQKKRKHV